MSDATSGAPEALRRTAAEAPWLTASDRPPLGSAGGLGVCMRCPRDETTLIEERTHGIEVDHCPTCNGRWLAHGELDQLEATRASNEDDRRGMIDYAQRESDLDCPICGERMSAFNYRGYDLELDTCHQEHGFWLDAGEEGRVRDIIDDRVRGLRRARSAEASWGDFLDGLRGGGTSGGGVWDSVRSFFGGRR